MKDRRPPYPPNMTPAPSGGMDPSEALAQRVALMRTQMAQSNQSPSSVQVAQAQAAGQGPSAQSRQPQRALPMPPSSANAELAIASRNLQQPQNRYIPGIQQKLREREFIAASQKAQEETAAMEMQERDEKYFNALTLLEKTRPNLPSDQRDALAREYAAGRSDLSYIIPEIKTDEELRELDQKHRKGQMEMDEMLKKQGDVIYDSVKENMRFISLLDRNKTQLEDIKNIGYNSGATQIAVLYSFIKGLDPDSVVREGEVDLARLGLSNMEDFDRAVQNITEVGVISENMFNALVDLTDKFIVSGEITNMRAIKRAQQRADQRNIPKEYVFSQDVQDMLGALEGQTKKPEPDPDVTDPPDDESDDDLVARYSPENKQ